MRGQSARMDAGQRAKQASVRSTLTLNYRGRLRVIFGLIIGKSLDGLTPGYNPSEPAPSFSTVDKLVKKRWVSLVDANKISADMVDSKVSDLLKGAEADIATCERIMQQGQGSSSSSEEQACWLLVAW